jgi:hypothetical protein
MNSIHPESRFKKNDMRVKGNYLGRRRWQQKEEGERRKGNGGMKNYQSILHECMNIMMKSIICIINVH